MVHAAGNGVVPSGWQATSGQRGGFRLADRAWPLTRLRATQNDRSRVGPRHLPMHLVSAERRLWIAWRRTTSGTRSAERPPRSSDAMPRQHPEDHFGRGPHRDLVDQCSACACPMRAHARAPRRRPSPRPSPRNRSSPATYRRAHHASACVRSVDKAPRKTPEKPAPPTSAETKNRWSGTCTPARGARLTSGHSGGGRI